MVYGFIHTFTLVVVVFSTNLDVAIANLEDSSEALQVAETCLYDADCHGAERICLDGICECLKETYIFDTIQQRCLPHNYMASLIDNSQDAAAVNVSLTLGIGIGVVAFAAAVAALITKCTKSVRNAEAEDTVLGKRKM